MYKGQKLIKLVDTKIIANAPKTTASVPLIIFVKYNTTIKTAAAIRIILSVKPMFFFIGYKFSGVKSILNLRYNYLINSYIKSNCMKKFAL